MTTIHERIKAQRKLAGLTQVELAKKKSQSPTPSRAFMKLSTSTNSSAY